MRKYYFLLLILMSFLMAQNAIAQPTFVETFDLMTALNWDEETWTGDNGFEWTKTGKGVPSEIDGQGVQLQGKGTLQSVWSGTIAGGISSFSVDILNKWNDGLERKLVLYINDTKVDSIVNGGIAQELYTFSLDSIDIAGDITIKVTNESPGIENRTLQVDNITWTSYYPAFIETFDLMTSQAWGAETWTGDNGFEWSKDGKGITGDIDGQGVQLQGKGTLQSVWSGTIERGISSFSVDIKNKWNGGLERKLVLYVNDTKVDTIVDAGTETETYNWSVDSINVSGDVIIKITNESPGTENRTLSVDNITWVPNDPPIAGIRVTGVDITPDSLELQLGKTFDLVATVVPDSAVNQLLSWSTSNDSITTVSTNGTVSGISEGTAFITVTANDGGFTDTCKVTVFYNYVTAVSVSQDSLELKLGHYSTLKSTVSPADANNPAVTWSSSDSTVATVVFNGIVSSVSEGTAYIIVTSDEGDFADSCLVIVSLATGVESPEELPSEFALEQNYPNPFNPSTTINYQLKEQGDVSLIIYNMLGQPIRTLVNGNQPAGYYSVTLNALNDSGSNLANGVYIYRLKSKSASLSKKMILLK